MIGTLLLSLALSMPTNIPPDPVLDCPVGLVCFTVREAGDIDLRMIALEKDVKLAKARSKKLGLTAGCGPGTSIEVVSGAVTFEPKVFCGVVWGLRW